MARIYLCSVAGQRTMEDGRERKVKERYLVSAVTPSDAEAILVSELAESFDSEFEVKSINDEGFPEVFVHEGDTWYKITVSFISIDEKTGKEKKTRSVMYLRSSGFSNALSDFLEEMKGTISDYETESISSTAIIDLIKGE